MSVCVFLCKKKKKNVTVSQTMFLSENNLQTFVSSALRVDDHMHGALHAPTCVHVDMCVCALTCKSVFVCLSALNSSSVLLSNYIHNSNLNVQGP